MALEDAMSWFNGVLSGRDWARRDRVEVVQDDGRRSVRLTAWGSRWTLEVDVDESYAFDGVIVSARVTDIVEGQCAPEVSGLAKALVP